MRFLDDIGLLSSRLTVAHGVHLTDEECALMAERSVTVAVNTACNLRLRSGVAPVGALQRTGAYPVVCELPELTIFAGLFDQHLHRCHDHR